MVSDIRLKTADTGGVMTCGRIPAGGHCGTTFPARRYKGTPFTISWQQQSTGYSVKNIRIHPPAGIASGQPALLVVLIESNGGVQFGWVTGR